MASGARLISTDTIEGFRDEQGLFGVAGHGRAAELAVLGLYAMQHRGDDGAGLVASDGYTLRCWRGAGSVGSVFSAGPLQGLVGRLAIGQVSRGGSASLVTGVIAAEPEMPVVGRVRGGQVAVTMAGKFTNGVRLRRDLEDRGAVLVTNSDAEVLLQWMAQSNQRTFVNRLVDALWKVEGAFSVLVCSEDRMIAVRDPRGFRPLVMGRIGSANVVASEGGAIRAAGGEVLREIGPGEMVILDPSGATTVTPFPKRPRAACLQELVQVAGVDAHVFGQDVYPVRAGFGERLAKEQPCARAQVVVGVPGAAESVALGYARASKLGVEPGLTWSTSGGPAVEPEGGGTLRFTAVPAVVSGKRVALVASSVVTGDGLATIVKTLRRAGASEVHVRIGSPPVRTGCLYGVASATDDEISASDVGNLLTLTRKLGADSVGWLSFEGLRAVAGQAIDGRAMWCGGCFTGEWPVVPETDGQLGLFDTEERKAEGR